MGHKTLIGGTAYEISGGKTLVNGTAYSIDKGKALVGGTAYEVGFAPKALNDYSWDEIRAISDAGQAANYFAVGDKKAVTLNGTVGNRTFSDETFYCYIIGIDHNSSKEGGNRIHFQFAYDANEINVAFVDRKHQGSASSGSYFNMNNSTSNAGGWASSLMRTIICPAFKNALPSELQTVLKTVTKYSDNTGGGTDTASYVTATTDTIFLLAEYEIFGVRTKANSAEQNYQEQYAWYADGNSTIKASDTSLISTVWKLRSVAAGETKYFCAVSSTGRTSINIANASYGFAPCFCV